MTKHPRSLQGPGALFCGEAGGAAGLSAGVTFLTQGSFDIGPMISDVVLSQAVRLTELDWFC